MVEAQISRKRQDPLIVAADEGVRRIDREEIRALRPASPDGLHTFATQTHPADGTAGALVTTTWQARELAQGEGVARVLATGFARTPAGRMPQAPVPAAMAALEWPGPRIP